MPIIKLLDPRTIDKIAAGEVVERPASVVKELVENALDAGAKAVTVELKDAGKALIRVSDDGCGMAPDDAELAFERHATSKLARIEDLDSLRTLGFRGEALSSIGAVARVELLTRSVELDVGTMVSIDFGKLASVKQAAREPGTSVYVRDLFENVPVRRKFMRGARAELANVSDIVAKTALAHPGVSFTFISDAKELFRTRGDGDLLRAIADVIGKDRASEMLPVESARGQMRLGGFVARPSVTRSSAQHQLFFVNGRPVSSAILAEGVEDGYRGLVMKERRPVVVLSLAVPPVAVDVNVHPTKREVRFGDELAVYDFVKEGVREALSKARLIPEPVKRREPTERPAGVEPLAPAALKQAKLAVSGDGAAAKRRRAEAADGELPLPRDSRAIGQVLDTYVVVEHSDGLFLLDQHAAHERVVFEALKSHDVSHARQSLLSPISIDVQPGQLARVREFAPMLSELGFEMEPFGSRAVLVRAVPVVAGELESAERLHDLVDDLERVGKAKAMEARRDELLHRVACHAAIRAGERLTLERMERLISEMRRLKVPYTCPHGRPVAIALSKRDLERMFGRVG
ncbi:MAG: DNA mismatch repair endonuclease MutL [Methanobacteriota archaeon]